MLRHAVRAITLCALSACATRSSAPCATDSWQGECQLAQVTKVEDKEFPVPHVVMEAVYRPIANDRYPGYTPGALSQRTMVKAALELALYDHLEAHARIPCATQPAPNGACSAPQVIVQVPELDQQAAEQRLAAPAASGCAQIEATAAQDAVRQNRQTQTVVAQRVSFTEGSASLPADADALANEVARLLAEKPQIECLGIVGQIAAGESPGLADQRAKAVRDLLGARGVAPTRLLTIAATAKVFGSGSRPGEADPADRRVSFSVLLEKIPQP
jgi:outer membrane protein OmpA-like peptidoglycan-associated protein